MIEWTVVDNVICGYSPETGRTYEIEYFSDEDGWEARDTGYLQPFGIGGLEEQIDVCEAADEELLEKLVK